MFFSIWGNQGSERTGYLSQVTDLVNDRAGTSTLVSWLQSSSMLFSWPYRTPWPEFPERLLSPSRGTVYYPDVTVQDTCRPVIPEPHAYSYYRWSKKLNSDESSERFFEDLEHTEQWSQTSSTIPSNKVITCLMWLFKLSTSKLI